MVVASLLGASRASGYLLRKHMRSTPMVAPDVLRARGHESGTGAAS